MRKLLLGTAAVALGMSFATGEAQAQVELGIGGHTQLYGVWLDQDEAGDDPNTPAVEADVDVRDVDIHRNTEIHFSGETTLDNGLTVGFHTEAEADGSDITGNGDTFDVQESYAYFSGAWGRVNFGAEDGATYLLQVAAPSADSNVDGLRQWINPINHASLSVAGGAAGVTDTVRLADVFGGGAGSIQAAIGGLDGIVFDAGVAGGTANDVRLGANGAAAANAVAIARRLDYDHADSGFENKLTYMTPVFNGFQAGVSYTPELGSTAGNGVNEGGAGNNPDDDLNDFGSVWEVAARWEGQFDQVGIAFGGGYSHADFEQDAATAGDGGCGAAIFYTDANGDGNCQVAEISSTRDDLETWNIGIDFDWKAFGLGGGYGETDNGVTNDDLETETWVVGIDYTTGPFKLGASYIDQDTKFGGAEVERDRWTGGVIYTYGPGMTFRGSVSYSDMEENIGQAIATDGADSDADATSFLLGTQINF